MDDQTKAEFDQAAQFVDEVLTNAKAFAAKHGLTEEDTILEIAGAIHSRFNDINMIRLHREEENSKPWE